MKHSKTKVCSMCHQELPISNFRILKDGRRGSWCYACENAYKRDEYRRKKKKPDGVYINKAGRLIDHKGFSSRIYWSPTMLKYLTENFATTKNHDLAIELGVSPSTVIRKARELGLEKSPVWVNSHLKTMIRMAITINRCRRNTGMFKPGEHANPAGEFKKKTCNI